MLPAKIRSVLLTAVLLFAWMALSPGHSSSDGQEPAKKQEKGAKLKELQKERLAVTRDFAKQASAKIKGGIGSLEELIEPTRMLLEAELDLCDSDMERIAVLEKILVTAKDTERMADAFAKRAGRQSTALMAKSERLRIEIALERAKTKEAGKPVEGNAGQDLRDQAALAEKQTAIKRAAVKIVEAQKAKAQATLATVKAQVAQAKAVESHAEFQFKRFNDLFKSRSIEVSLLDEARAKLEAAKAKRAGAETQVAEAEGQVAIEHARIVQAELEFEEAELRAKQFKARLGLGSQP